MKLHRFSTALLAAVTVAAIAACSDDDDDNPVGTGNDNTTVRFVNAMTGGTALDIAQNSTVGSGNGNIAFGSASSCTRVNNANPQLAVRTAGSTTSLTGFTPSFAANGTYTVLVTGTTAAPVFTTFNDQFTAPGAGNAAVRIINATSLARAAVSTPRWKEESSAAPMTWLSFGGLIFTRRRSSRSFGAPTTSSSPVRRATTTG